MPCTATSLLDEPVVFSLLVGAIAHEGDSMVQLLCLPHAAWLLVNACISLAHLNLSKAAKVNWYNGFLLSSCHQLWCTLEPKAHNNPESSKTVHHKATPHISNSTCHSLCCMCGKLSRATFVAWLMLPACRLTNRWITANCTAILPSIHTSSLSCFSPVSSSCPTQLPPMREH